MIRRPVAGGLGLGHDGIQALNVVALRYAVEFSAIAS